MALTGRPNPPLPLSDSRSVHGMARAARGGPRVPSERSFYATGQVTAAPPGSEQVCFFLGAFFLTIV